MKKKIRLLACLLTVMAFVILLTNSCKKDDNNNNPTPPQTVTDIDGNVYHTVTIGSQVWMVENLKASHYRNGDSISNVTDSANWFSLSTGAYCDYNNTASNSTIYGKLYNWYTVKDSRNIAPVGWHVPSDAEWTTLTTYIGGNNIAGGKLKEIGNTHWVYPNTGATNETGFTALPAGNRSLYTAFDDIGKDCFWWSSTEYNTYSAYFRGINFGSSIINTSYYTKGAGYSVRCIKDN